jgi:hypothetical protein
MAERFRSEAQKLWFVWGSLGVFLLCAVSSLMRKNDQAYLLAGAWDLLHNHSWFSANYYAYSRSFGVYWLLAAFLKVTGASALSSSSWLASTNILNLILYWGSLGVMMTAAVNRRSLVPWIVVLTSPIFLTTAIYVNTSAFSLAWFWLAAFCAGRRSGLAMRIMYPLMFLAVSSRADIILQVPLFCWLMCETKNFRSLVGPFTKLIIPSVLAICLGITIAGEASQVTDFYFKPKIVGAFAAFGMGGGLVYWAGLGLVFLRMALSARGNRLIFYGLGFASYVLPVLFYLPQMHTPRYLILGLQSILMLTIFRRGRALLSLSRNIVGRHLRTLIVGVSLASLFVGISAPSPGQLTPTIKEPTLFPTSDGLMAIGATIPFLIRLNHATTVALDHHQAVWNAVLNASLEPGSDGRIPVLNTKMSAYFELKAAMNGQWIRMIPVDQASFEPFFYAEKRAFREVNRGMGTDKYNGLLDFNAQMVSGSSDHDGILQFHRGDNAWSYDVRLFKSRFPRLEFKIHGVYDGRCVAESCGAGYRHVLFSSERFSYIDLDRKSSAPSQTVAVESVVDLESGIWFADLGLLPMSAALVHSVAPVLMATSANLEWMMSAVR